MHNIELFREVYSFKMLLRLVHFQVVWAVVSGEIQIPDEKVQANSHEVAFCLSQIIPFLTHHRKVISIAVPLPSASSQSLDRLVLETMVHIDEQGQTAWLIESTGCINYVGRTIRMDYVLFFDNETDVVEVFSNCVDNLPGSGLSPIIVFSANVNITARVLDGLTAAGVPSAYIVKPADDSIAKMHVLHFKKKRLHNIDIDCNIRKDVHAINVMHSEGSDEYVVVGFQDLRPFAYRDEGTGEYEGLQLSMLKAMGMNLRYHVDEDFGTCSQRTRQCTGLLGALQKGHVDILAGLIVFNQYDDIFQSCYSYRETRKITIAKTDPNDHYKRTPDQNFMENDAAVFVAILFLASVIISYYSGTVIPRASFFGVVLYWWGLILGIRDNSIKMGHIRWKKLMTIMVILFLFLSLVLRAFYQMRLVPFLLQEKIELQRNNFLDICGTENVIIFVRSFEVLPQLDCPIPEDNYIRCDRPLRCLNSSSADTNTNYAAVMDETVFKAYYYRYENSNKKTIRMLKSFKPDLLTFLVKKRNPLEYYMYRTKLYLDASGIYLHIEEQTNLKSRISEERTRKDLEGRLIGNALSMTQLITPFSILIWGQITSVIIFVAEIARSVIKKQQLRRLMGLMGS